MYLKTFNVFFRLFKDVLGTETRSPCFPRYNLHSGFGNWFPGIKTLMQRSMNKVMQANPALCASWARDALRRLGGLAGTLP